MPELELAQDICGEENPVTGRTCVAGSRYRHVHHRDADGRQWPNSPSTPADTMSMEQATGEVYYWAQQRLEARDRAFDDLLGWVAGRAITGDPHAADTLRRIRHRAERP